MSDDAGSGDGSPDHAVAMLEHVTRSLVEEPDGVDVQVADIGSGRLQLNVTVADGDMGRVIGKRGRMANAIRTVTRAAAVRDGVEVDIEFLD